MEIDRTAVEPKGTRTRNVCDCARILMVAVQNEWMRRSQRDRPEWIPVAPIMHYRKTDASAIFGTDLKIEWRA
jgi:hypothetical protein